ncbi:hypothetical protein [Corynebacterium guangdongense]|uniref:Dienelactone hydrolase n=1 Tax=Corynebacterium guangdongense TaxID=1783348 RepID=A0ABU1ZXB6_9CORY|nr:hypothetical protein [Corynebacterium guangdongense]MDR7329582.1 putative dienelactone hydrolase [Corynebacterium guangdongense]WJZ18147.1 hypothetical protein CGUA_07925 [Corynebacterium guangdongense]
MRSIRNSAIAGATALAVAFGGTTIASAQDPTLDAEAGAEVTLSGDAPASGDAELAGEVEGPQAEAPEEGYTPSLSSDINTGSSLEGEEPANGTAIFGSSKEGFGDQPRWAQLLYAGSILGSIASLIGLVVGPIHNYIVHGQ